MKKTYLFVLASLLANISTVRAEDINLPQPEKSSSLMQLIDARKTSRDFSDKKISEQELSNILWAAFGTNNHNTRTIPTARNQQKLKVFVVYEKGVWQYDGQANKLLKISDEDLMPYLAKQDFVEDAPVHLIYAGEQKFADAHSGSAYQNVYLYATEKGLATVIRAMVDKDALHDKLKLEEDEVVTYHQPIGYPAE